MTFYSHTLLSVGQLSIIYCFAIMDGDTIPKNLTPRLGTGRTAYQRAPIANSSTEDRYCMFPVYCILPVDIHLSADGSHYELQS